jgi:hypothetical protein
MKVKLAKIRNYPGSSTDGERIARSRITGCISSDRVGITLETLKRTSLAQSKYGAVLSAGRSTSEIGILLLTLRIHPPGTFMLAMLPFEVIPTDGSCQRLAKS